MLWCIGIAGAAVSVLPLLRMAQESPWTSCRPRESLDILAFRALGSTDLACDLEPRADLRFFRRGARWAARRGADFSGTTFDDAVFACVDFLREHLASERFAPDRSHDARRELALLARRSVILVIVLAGGYALLLAVALPLLD